MRTYLRGMLGVLFVMAMLPACRVASSLEYRSAWQEESYNVGVAIEIFSYYVERENEVEVVVNVIVGGPLDDPADTTIPLSDIGASLWFNDIALECIDSPRGALDMQSYVSSGAWSFQKKTSGSEAGRVKLLVTLYGDVLPENLTRT